jgi:hypothetical protein
MIPTTGVQGQLMTVYGENFPSTGAVLTCVFVPISNSESSGSNSNTSNNDNGTVGDKGKVVHVATVMSSNMLTCITPTIPQLSSSASSTTTSNHSIVHQYNVYISLTALFSTTSADGIPDTTENVEKGSEILYHAGVFSVIPSVRISSYTVEIPGIISGVRTLPCLADYSGTLLYFTHNFLHLCYINYYYYY